MSTFSPKQKTEFHKRSKSNKWGYLGVKSSRGRFQAYIRNGSTKVYCGQARTAEEAAKLYDIKARELFGDDAVVNFPGVKP